MNKEKLKGLQSFLKDDIWRVTEDEVSKSRGILYNAIKIATLSVREFTQGRILNKASALTYSTLLSIIPILAILFAIARGFGFSNLLETQFRSGLEGQSAAAETILGLIDSYLVHAKSGIFIGVGLVMLFCIIRKTKCSCDLERNVLQRKTKRYRNTIFPKIFSTGLRRFYKLR